MTRRQFTPAPLTDEQRAHRAACFARREATRGAWVSWEADRARRDAASVRDLELLWTHLARLRDDDESDNPEIDRRRELDRITCAVDVTLAAEREGTR
jgi:hypothetical protein